ncbi:MAG: PqqD family protein [Planctomycetes bacterium]|nr:PqqD family protein [Planctomycetota bacterium]
MRRMPEEHWTAQDVFIPPPRRKDLLVEILDEEAILYDPATAQTHRLSRSALDVWQQCDSRRTTLDMARRQTQIYDVDQETALDHVEQLVALFAEAGLLDLRDESW